MDIGNQNFYVVLKKYKLSFLIYFANNMLLAAPQILSQLQEADEDQGSVACKFRVAKGKE